MACIVLPEAFVALNFPVADVIAARKGNQLLAIFKYVHVTYTPVESNAQLGFRVVLSKMRGSERQRPDALQLAVFSQ